MTDHIDPDKLRDVIAGHWAEGEGDLLKDHLQALLTPSRPTLADLIEEGHDPAQYQWTQADHRDMRCIIVRTDGQPSRLTASLLTATGATIWASTDEVIPHPDKPRLVWPAESHPEPAEDSPEPQVGEAWLVSTREGGQREALKAGNRWYVKDGDDVQDWVEKALIPIARLVPEPAEETTTQEMLVTEGDYENAPYGTICAEDGHFPLYTSTWTWYTIGGDSHNHSDLAGTPRRVLRWGTGERGYSHQEPTREPSTQDVNPKTLTTEEDYKNASLDTVVKDTTYPRSDVWDKWYANDWRTTTRHGSCKRNTDAELADTTRHVIWAPEEWA